MKTIKGRIILNFVVLVLLFAILGGGGAIYLNVDGTLQNLEICMTEIANTAVKLVDSKLETYRDIIKETGLNKDLSDPDVSIKKKKDILNEKCETYGYEAGDIVDKKGESLLYTKKYGEYSFFKKALKGEITVSEPMKFGKDGEMVVVLAAPLCKNGDENDIDGCVIYVLDAKFLSEIVQAIAIGESGRGYMIDKNGTVIAYKDYSLVTERVNRYEMAKTDPKVVALANLEKKMMKGGRGFGDYEWDGDRKLMGYAPVENTDGWSVAVTVNYDELMATTKTSTITIVIITIIILIMAAYMAIRLARLIAIPVKECADRLNKLSEGDLKSPTPSVKSKDEILVLATSTKKIVEDTNAMINDAEYLLEEMKNGNFDIESKSKDSYQGDYEPLRISIEDIRDSLSSTLAQINEAADQVACGSEQVSMASQSLAQGATEQAASVNDLDRRVNHINDEIKNNAKNALEAKVQTENAGVMITDANAQMQNMINAMNDISQKSNEIAKIIKTIDDIAFQTNILALNAAVEAARAGSAGKGFSVVADEVRNLAGKSAEAAQNTALLIEQSVQAVSKGKDMADETGKAITEVLEAAGSVVQLVNDIVISCEKQGEESDRIKEGTDQIDKVVQTNSATSEESAAAAEELNSQATMLKDLVAYFKLRDEYEADEI